MSALKFGSFEVSGSFVVTVFIVVVLAYLVLSGRLDPIELYHDVLSKLNIKSPF
jgi:hypothetical protein